MLTIVQHRLCKKLSAILATLSSAQDKVYYFGYGANIDPDFFKKRGITFKIIGVGRLENYKFEFNTPCEYKNKGFGGISPTDGSYVLGTLDELSSSSLGLLDLLEWVPFNFYSRKKFNIKCEDVAYESEVYVPNFPSKDLYPSTGYKNLVINGAKKIYCPADYIDCLSSYPS